MECNRFTQNPNLGINFPSQTNRIEYIEVMMTSLVTSVPSPILSPRFHLKITTHGCPVKLGSPAPFCYDMRTLTERWEDISKRKTVENSWSLLKPVPVIYMDEHSGCWWREGTLTWMSLLGLLGSMVGTWVITYT